MIKFNEKVFRCCMGACIVFYAISLAADNPRAINKHGVELGEKKLLDQAIDEFNSAINLYNQQSAQAFHNRGWAYEQKGDFPNAIKSYEEALYRAPLQVLTGEKLGFLYYNTGDFRNAVRIGEHVLKVSPDNAEVTRWLPDAYIQMLKKQREEELARKKAEEEERKKKEGARKKEEEVKEAEQRILLATFDFMIRTGYYFSGEKGYRYISDPGLFVDVPETLYANFTPVKQWEFNLTVENPFLGALSPNCIIQREIADARYEYKEYLLGVGFMLNHYEGSLAFGEHYALSAFTMGFIFGFTKDKVRMSIILYPRILSYITHSDVGKSFETSGFRVNYTYDMGGEMKFYSIISCNDYYYIDHTNAVSDFWGVYDIGFGVTLGMINRSSNKRSYSFSVELTERFYLRDLNNSKPYQFLNGQGYFGLNKNKWILGDPISGLSSLSQVLGVKAEEYLMKNFFIYQKLIFEFGDIHADHNEFNLLLGAGYIY